MKSLFIIMILLIGFNESVYADSSYMDIAEAEQSITDDATVEMKYSENIVIDSRELDGAVKAAISKYKEYKDQGIVPSPKKNVRVKMKNCESEVSFIIDDSIKNYDGAADEIEVDAGDFKVYLKPSEVNGFSNGQIGFSFKDTDEILGEYSGRKENESMKNILVAIFILIGVATIIFLLVVSKNQFKEGFNKNLLYITGCVVTIMCFMMAAMIIFVDIEDENRHNKISEDGSEHIFEIKCGKDISGIYVGIPLYDAEFSEKYVSAAMKDEGGVAAERIIGGKYYNADDMIKFPVNNDGKYYLKNNMVVFNDLDSGNEELNEAVSVLASKNIVNGKAEGTFAPNDSITRAEIVTMLCNMLYLQEETDVDDFEDVSSSDWYYEYVMTGRANDLLAGYDDNTFHPTDNITREQMASISSHIMTNYFGYDGNIDESVLDEYNDKDEIAFWAVSSAALLKQKDILIWREYLEPQRTLTRGEAAILLYRLYMQM